MRVHIAHAKWIKVSDQVATDAIGADNHQRADAIENGRTDLTLGEAHTFVGSFAFDLGRCCLRLGSPLTVKRGGQIVVRNWRPIGATP